MMYDNTCKEQKNRFHTRRKNEMTRAQAIKKIWDLVTEDKIREAEELARKYSVEMCFGENYIAIEDDVFYF